MTANVEIILAHRENVLTVPVRAVYHDGQQAMVDVISADGSAVPTKVALGLTDNTVHEITHGLEKGQQVEVHKGQLDSRWSNQGRQRHRL